MTTHATPRPRATRRHDADHSTEDRDQVTRYITRAIRGINDRIRSSQDDPGRARFYLALARAQADYAYGQDIAVPDAGHTRTDAMRRLLDAEQRIGIARRVAILARIPGVTSGNASGTLEPTADPTTVARPDVDA